MQYPPQGYNATLQTISNANSVPWSIVEGEPENFPSDVFFGRRYLHEWFERQYNADTARTGQSNYRVSVMHCGDSLAERLCGWISVNAAKDYPDNQGRGLGNTTFALTGPPNDVFVLSGTLGDSTGDASRLSGQFQLWPDGFVYDLGSTTGVVTFPPRKVVRLNIYGADDRPFDTIRVAYIAASGQGSFDIETSPDGTTWTKQGATVNTSNASTIGAMTTRTVTRGVYHVRIRHVSGGRCKVIGLYTGFAKTVAGFEAFAMSAGGTTPSQWATCPLAIVTPILQELDPALITWHCADTPQEYTDHFDELMAISRAGNPNRSVLWIASHSYANPGADEETETVRQFLRSKVDSHKIALFDLRALTGTYANIQSYGLEGDGIHLDQLLYAYGYKYLEQSLRMRSEDKLRFDPATINNLPKLFATQGQAFGATLTDITEPGVRYITNATGTPNGEQGTCISFGVGPESTHPFALFAVQFFIPAFSGNSAVYKRHRNNGTWSSWVTGGSVFDPTTINNLPKLFATQGQLFGATLTDITEPGVRYITNPTGTPNGEQGTCISFGIGPESTHQFALFAVQLFVPAFSSNGLLYKRHRNMGTWSAWQAVGDGTYLPLAAGGTVTGPIVSSGANGKIGVPILSTANRTAQANKTNGDFFIDQASGRAVFQKSGIDTFTLAAEPISEYATIRELLRGVREFDAFLASGQYSTIVASGGAVTSTQFGRTLVTNTTAGATSRLIWNPGTIANLGVSIHSVAGVDARCIPWNRRVILQWRWTNSVWRDQTSATTAITSFGQGVFARVYFGCVGTGSNYTLNVRGVGLHITDQGQMRLVAHNGTTLTESANLGQYFSNGIGSLSESFTIESDGLGNVTLYQNGALLGSITGGPTTVNTVNQSGVSWEVGNGTSTTNVSWAVGMHKIGVF